METVIPIKEMEMVTPEYKALMEKAVTVDYTPIINSNCFLPVGMDEDGTPVFLIIGSNLPTTKSDMEILLMYMIKTLEPIVTGNLFTLVYCHSLLKQESTPERSWLTSIYHMLPRNYKKNMKHLYIIHPTTWLRVLFFAMSPFLSEKVWGKIEYLDYLQELPIELDRSLILSKIPQQVKEYDESLLAEPEITEKVITSMDTLGKELLSSLHSPYFSSFDPNSWTAPPKK
eukprot:gene5526-6884_t